MSDLPLNRQANRSSKRLPHKSYPFFSPAEDFVSYSDIRPLSTNSAGFCTHHLSQWKICPWMNKQNHLICLILLKLLASPSLLQDHTVYTASELFVPTVPASPPSHSFFTLAWLPLQSLSETALVQGAEDLHVSKYVSWVFLREDMTSKMSLDPYLMPCAKVNFRIS